MAGNNHFTPPTRNRSLKRMKSIRAAQLREVEMKMSRPMSGLDKKAEELGIYNDQFHCLSRQERKQRVSLAFSKQLHAA